MAGCRAWSVWQWDAQSLPELLQHRPEEIDSHQALKTLNPGKMKWLGVQNLLRKILTKSVHTKSVAPWFWDDLGPWVRAVRLSAFTFLRSFAIDTSTLTLTVSVITSHPCSGVLVGCASHTITGYQAVYYMIIIICICFVCVS